MNHERLYEEKKEAVGASWLEFLLRKVSSKFFYVSSSYFFGELVEKAVKEMGKRSREEFKPEWVLYDLGIYKPSQLAESID